MKLGPVRVVPPTAGEAGGLIGGVMGVPAMPEGLFGPTEEGRGTLMLPPPRPRTTGIAFAEKILMDDQDIHIVLSLNGD